MIADAALEKQPQKMSVARRLALEVAIGAVLGFVTWSIVGPSVMGWWYEPPSKDALSCASSVRHALSQFVLIEIITAVGGGVSLAVALFLVRRLFRPKDG